MLQIPHAWKLPRPRQGKSFQIFDIEETTGRRDGAGGFHYDRAVVDISTCFTLMRRLGEKGRLVQGVRITGWLVYPGPSESGRMSTLGEFSRSLSP